MRRLAVVVAGLAVMVACGGSSSAMPLPFHRVGEVALPGRATRLDYADVDASRHLLVVAHLGDSQVVAVDLARRQVLWTSDHIPSVHGVRIVPALGRVFATATGSDQLVALDESTGAELGRAPTGRFPDGVAFDPTTTRVLVSDKDGGTVTVVDAHTVGPLGRVAVGGDVGNVQASGDRVAVAVGHANQLLELDSANLRVTGAIALPGCNGAHGVALDPSRPTAYVACENNATLVVVDLAGRRVTARLRVGDQPDVLAIDGTARQLYVAAESGTVTVIRLNPTPTVIGRAHYADGAHTVAVDPSSHLIAFALSDSDGHAVLRLESPRA